MRLSREAQVGLAVATSFTFLVGAAATARLLRPSEGKQAALQAAPAVASAAKDQSSPRPVAPAQAEAPTASALPSPIVPATPRVASVSSEATSADAELRYLEQEMQRFGASVQVQPRGAVLHTSLGKAGTELARFRPSSVEFSPLGSANPWDAVVQGTSHDFLGHILSFCDSLN